MNHTEWETLAQKDAMWAICADPTKKRGRWNKEEFFATGETEVSRIFAYLSDLQVLPDLSRPALDLGCGVGRLTRALGNRFQTVYGVDVTPTMVNLAREWNADRSSLNFTQLRSDDLSPFPNKMFGFIYSSLVLQHLRPAVANHYIREFMRVADTGSVVVFQLTDSFAIYGNVFANEFLHDLKNRIRVRTRLHDALVVLKGKGENNGMPVLKAYGLAESKVRRTINESGGQVIDIQFTNSLKPDFNGNLEFLSERPTYGWVSKQYCVVKG